MLDFQARVAVEGRKEKASRSLRITVPAAGAAQMMVAGCAFPGWVRLTVAGGEPIFAFARRALSRPTVEVVLPSWRFPAAQQGDTLVARVEDARPFRATPGGEGFDWLPFVTEHYFAVDDGEDLVLWNRYEEPFRLRRRPRGSEHWWLLGFYQAEGSKAASGADWSLASSLPKPLRAVADVAETSWGITRERLYTQVLYAVGEAPEAAEAVFGEVGARRAATRLRPGEGGHAASLHVMRSLPLRRLTIGALAHVFDCGFPSSEAARAYALGWLDGDGTITVLQPLYKRRGYCLELRLAGQDREQQVTLRALHRWFGWNEKGGAFGGIRHHTARTLNVREAAELAVAGGFRFSLSRVRLLYEIERRCAGAPQHMRAEDLAYARALLNELQPEMETLRRLMPPERVPKGAKGVPYPL